VKRAAALVALLMLAACGHPGIPAPTQTPATPTRPHATAPAPATAQPVLGVDLYTLGNYPAAVVEADGRRMLAYIKNVLKANAVGVVWDFYAASPRSSAVESTNATLSASNVAILTKIAHDDHLLVEYRPLIMVSGRLAWEGNIAPHHPAAWFHSYYTAELPYFKIAQKLRISEFVAATELHRLNASPLWPSFFARAASVYHGITSYAAWDGDYLHGRLLQVNSLGMDMYEPLRLPPAATPAEVTAAWENTLSQVPASVLHRTAIDETGIQARAGAYANPPAMRIPGALDEQVQANWYIAACATVKRYHMRGVFFWKTDLTDEPTHPAASLSTFEARQGAAAIKVCATLLH
jgi:hypothetical protein